MKLLVMPMHILLHLETYAPAAAAAAASASMYAILVQSVSVLLVKPVVALACQWLIGCMALQSISIQHHA